MRENMVTPSQLSGSLLVAHPGLLDPNFRRSVIVIASSDAADGALGFIINRPTGRTVAELLPGEEDLGLLACAPVCFGGPVGVDRLMFAALRWTGTKFECRSHLDAEEAQAISKESAVTVRAFIGYAGWSTGQLESELAQEAWVVRPSRPEVLDLSQSGELWRGIMRGMGPWFRLMAAAPEDPSLN